MNDAFEDRKKKFEEKWAHDEALRFKIAARAHRLLGAWAAGELGLLGADAEEYAKSVVAADLKAARGSDAFAKIRADFDAAQLAHSDHLIMRKFEELRALAADQMTGEART